MCVSMLVVVYGVASLISPLGNRVSPFKEMVPQYPLTGSVTIESIRALRFWSFG